MLKRLFVDLDGVTVDFDAHMTELGQPGHIVKTLPGAYRSMRPVAGALDAIREAIHLGYEVWIATKPPTGIPHAYAEKAEWVLEHLPELATRIIITHDKGLLGGEDDYLVDDRPHKANCETFRGTLLHYRPGYQWTEVLDVLRANAPGATPPQAVAA